jgi:hypothetical protein
MWEGEIITNYGASSYLGVLFVTAYKRNSSHCLVRNWKLCAHINNKKISNSWHISSGSLSFTRVGEKRQRHEMVHLQLSFTIFDPMGVLSALVSYR